MKRPVPSRQIFWSFFSCATPWPTDIPFRDTADWGIAVVGYSMGSASEHHEVERGESIGLSGCLWINRLVFYTRTRLIRSNNEIIYLLALIWSRIPRIRSCSYNLRDPSPVRCPLEVRGSIVGGESLHIVLSRLCIISRSPSWLNLDINSTYRDRFISPRPFVRPSPRNAINHTGEILCKTSGSGQSANKYVFEWETPHCRAKLKM